MFGGGLGSAGGGLYSVTLEGFSNLNNPMIPKHLLAKSFGFRQAQLPTTVIVPPWTRWCHMETSGTGPSTPKTASNEFSVVNIEPEEGQSSRQSVKTTTPLQKEKRERRLKSSWTSPLSPSLILWALKCCPSALGGRCSFLIGRDRGY